MMKRGRDTDIRSLRKRNMRSRFKKLVRSVMLNYQWLDEPEDNQPGISMNVKKNVALLVRQKRKTGLLTVTEKALLRTEHLKRSTDERQRMCMIIANLPCFSRIAPKLRARLVSVVRFATIQADRVIVKEGDIPIFVYFVISGEIEMKKKVYDKATKKTSMISEAIIGAGDWIGEVEILEDCTRLYTYVALTPCELLSITDDEFKKILGPSIKKQWQEKKSALKSLNYFDFLTEEQIVRACYYSVLAQYDPLQSIYSEDRGAVSCVHFILSGECVMLQCLKMRVVKLHGVNTYELIQVDNSGLGLFDNSRSMRSLSSTFQSVQQKQKLLSDSYFVLTDLLDSSSDGDDEETIQKKKALRKMGLRDIEIACGLGRTSHLTRGKRKLKTRAIVRRRTTILPRRRTTVYSKEAESVEDESVEDEMLNEEYFNEEYMEEINEEIESTTTESIEKSTPIKTPSNKSERLNSSQLSILRQSTVKPIMKPIVESAKPSINTVHIESDDSDYDDVESSSDAGSSSPSSYSRQSENKPVVPVTETHFVDIGSLTYGGIFGLGEKMAHRVIMARTVVQCLLLPRYWLMEVEQNPGNVWQRRRFYLECSIPSREELFGNFLKTRRWEKFKHDYVQSTLNPNSVNSTQPEDIPIICRIVETRDNI